MTDIIGALVIVLVIAAFWIGHELSKINRSLKRIGRGTEAERGVTPSGRPRD
jgi:hypothetical protein